MVSRTVMVRKGPEYVLGARSKRREQLNPTPAPREATRRSEGSPGDIADELLVVHHHAQLAGTGRKHVQGLGEHGQLLTGSRSKDDGSPPRLGHAVLASLGRKGHA